MTVVSVYKEDYTERAKRLVRLTADADNDLHNFFGSIDIADQEPRSGNPRPPWLQIHADPTFVVERMMDDQGRVALPVRLVIGRPRPIPATYSVDPPTVPTTSTPFIGTLTGTYLYCRTACDRALGESYASPMSAPRTVTNKTIAVAFSASSFVTRLWRTEAGSLAFRWLTTLLPGVTGFRDNVPDDELGDELAPILGAWKDVPDAVCRVFSNSETMIDPLTFRQTADATLAFAGMADKLERNVHLTTLLGHFTTRFSVTTGESQQEQS